MTDEEIKTIPDRGVRLVAAAVQSLTREELEIYALGCAIGFQMLLESYGCNVVDVRGVLGEQIGKQVQRISFAVRQLVNGQRGEET